MALIEQRPDWHGRHHRAPTVGSDHGHRHGPWWIDHRTNAPEHSGKEHHSIASKRTDNSPRSISG